MLVLRLGVALERYWEARSGQQEALELLAPALQRPEARADPALFAAALIAAAAAARFIDIATALDLADKGVQVASRSATTGCYQRPRRTLQRVLPRWRTAQGTAVRPGGC